MRHSEEDDGGMLRNLEAINADLDAINAHLDKMPTKGWYVAVLVGAVIGSGLFMLIAAWLGP